MAATWEPYVAAAFAPTAVWLLWRGQTLSVEALRWRLLALARAARTRWVYATVSWFGVLLHEVSHASVLLLSGHGIREFRAGVEAGHVLPSRLRYGPIGFLSFLLAALAPLFIPPLLVLLALRLLADSSVLAAAPSASGLAAAFDALRDQLLWFPVRLGQAVAALDLSDWRHGIVFAAILLAMPSSRPSHVKGSRFHGTQDEGDVVVLRARIRRQPILFIAFLLLLYAAYFATVALPQASAWYWSAFGFLWDVALTGIALCLFGAAWWTLVALGNRTWLLLAWLGPAAFVAVEVLARWPVDRALPAWQVNAFAVAAWAAIAGAAALLAPRRPR